MSNLLLVVSLLATSRQATLSGKEERGRMRTSGGLGRETGNETKIEI